MNTSSLSALIVDAMREPLFADRWQDATDSSFRPLAVAALDLAQARTLSAAGRRTLYQQLCTGKRRQVLAGLAGKPVPQAVVNLLGKLHWERMTRNDWPLFFAAALDSDSRVLSCLTRITPCLVRQFARVPEPLRQHGLLEVLNDHAVPAARWQRWRRFCEQADSNWLFRFREEAAAVKTAGDLWDLYFLCEGKSRLPFAIPAALEGSPLLVPLRYPEEMTGEGRRMRNCMGELSDRVQRRRNYYFKARDGGLLNAEIVYDGGRWSAGKWLGYGNGPVDQQLEEKIFPELRRLAEALNAAEQQEPVRQASKRELEVLNRAGTELFGAGALAQVEAALRHIRAKTVSWSNGAYVILDNPDGGYVQLMSSEDGREYLIELSSHKYLPEVNDLLTAATVDLIEKAGFTWPHGRSNFKRWLEVPRAKDLARIAVVALALLAMIFGRGESCDFDISCHVPA
ncbi:MAG: hypothetical protein A3G80_02410 [Betaproteobacteria bacterium RIFCSPLOWO2_12_FULL_62_13b]|nr:MAG: hypothetical protein A3G80_02410 [Betaproteobacteria bacterium RIFCSPLOWO2_12_FULL_62_13b]